MKIGIMRNRHRNWVAAIFVLLVSGGIFYFTKTDDDQGLRKEHFSLQSEEGLYWSSDQWQNYLIIADKPHAYTWEILTFFFIDSTHVKIKNFSNHFIEVNEDGFLRASADFSEGSVFKLDRIGYNEVILRLGDKNLIIDPLKRVKVTHGPGPALKLRIRPEVSEIALQEEQRAKEFKIYPFYYQFLIIIGFLFLLNKFTNVFEWMAKNIFILPVLIYPYIIYRAYNLSLVIDEAWSVDILLNKPYYFRALFFDDTYFYIANNHVLNTVFGYISSSLFGISPISLRAFNVLAFALYALYSVKLLKLQAKGSTSILLGAGFLFLNPFLLEYFSLYRGYGLSLAFFSGFLYYISKIYLEGHKNKLLILGIICSILSIYANFALIIPVFVVQLGYFLHLHQEKKILEIIVDRSTLIFLIGACLLIPAVSNILILSAQNELYFGGDESFLKNTLSSILDYSFTIKNQLDKVVLQTIFISLFFSSFFLWKKNKQFSIGIILFGIILLSSYLNLVAKSKFVIERASLYFIPLMAMFLIKTFDAVFKSKSYRWVICLFIAFLSLSGLRRMEDEFNLYRTTTWEHDVANDQVLPDIIAANGNGKFSLAVFWIFNPPMQYYANYQGVNELDKLISMEDEPIKVDADFYYIRMQDLRNVNFEYDVIKRYEKANTILLRKKF